MTTVSISETKAKLGGEDPGDEARLQRPGRLDLVTLDDRLALAAQRERSRLHPDS